MTAPDFQSEEWRWAAQMACDEVNKHGARLRINEVDTSRPALYALALRIARTEARPVDPLYDALFEVVELGRYDTREQTALLRKALLDRGFEIAALKEGRGL